MRSAAVPPDEADRLAALRALAVLDTPPEPAFDRLARLASTALEAPIALVVLIDEDRQWFKARVGVDLDHTGRDVAFCAHAIVDRAPGPFIVPDAADDERFHDNPLVLGEPFVRFYAGQPVRSPSGHRVGTLCVMDRVPRTLSDRQRAILVDLAALVEDLLAQPELTARHLLDATWLAAPVGLAILDERGLLLEVNEAFSSQLGVAPADVIGRPAVDFIHADDAPLARSDYVEAHRTGRPTPSRDQRLVTSDGSARWISSTACPILEGDRRLFVVATVDMTERRRLESDLRRFHHLFEHANDVITVVAGDGTPLYASPSSERLLGFPEGYRPDAGITGFVHPDDVGAARVELQALIDGTRGDEPFVVRVIDARGEVKHLECMGVNLLDEPDVAGVVITSRDVSERQRLDELLAHRATHDDLTGLANRTLFVERLSAALARSARDRHRVAVCFLDLDDFKEINDRFGHAAGDELLTDVAGRLQAHVRAGDEVARIGGDEFLVLFDPVDDEAHALAAAERLVEVVTGDRTISAGRVWSGATAGVAIGRPGEESAALMARADAALYRAKAAGKARAVLDER